MILKIKFTKNDSEVPVALLDGETECEQEFWFGRALAWVGAGEGRGELHLALLVDTARIVARTKRRDREQRFAVGYCDSYPYTAAGLMAVCLAELKLWRRADAGLRCVSMELTSIPAAAFGIEIAKRLLLPLGYSVSVAGRKLVFAAERSLRQTFQELPVLLLALDRRTRLILADEERFEIGHGSREWMPRHPAARAIELALEGHPTALRLLVPGAPKQPKESDATERSEVLAEPVTTALVPKIEFSPSQAQYGRRMFSKINIDRNWLIYLPAAVASVQTKESDSLERPADSIAYFRDERVEKVVVEEKHMGSRGIVVVCRSLEAAKRRFGVVSETPGCVYTRNGRKFFGDEDTQAVFFDRIERVLSAANFWKRFSTDWACFDGEVLPWAIKASDSPEESDLVESGTAAITETLSALPLGAEYPLSRHWRELVETENRALLRYDDMFKHYRTESANLAAIKFAPFHLLATEGRTFFGRSHLWHMQTLSRIARSGHGFIIPTRFEVVETTRPEYWDRVLRWWDELSEASHEGLVIKPLPFVPRGRRGLAQPALKCRTREHLRLVYGPRYDACMTKELLAGREALRNRRNKHRRILRQFALSMEAVNRFVKRSPMDAVHECVLGVLAQEVAPVTRQ